MFVENLSSWCLNVIFCLYSQSPVSRSRFRNQKLSLFYLKQHYECCGSIKWRHKKVKQYCATFFQVSERSCGIKPHNTDIIDWPIDYIDWCSVLCSCLAFASLKVSQWLPSKTSLYIHNKCLSKEKAVW